MRRRITPQNVTQIDVDAVRAKPAKEKEASRQKLAVLTEQVEECQARAAAAKALCLSVAMEINAKIDEGLFREVLGLVGRPLFTEGEIESFFDDAKALRKRAPMLYVNLALMARSVVEYERELRRVERRAMELEVEVEVLGAVRRFECWRGEGGDMRDGKGAGESADKNENANVARGRVPGVGGVEERELVDLREWPLPPKRTSWVMVQGERKRKRHAKH